MQLCFYVRKVVRTFCFFPHKKWTIWKRWDNHGTINCSDRLKSESLKNRSCRSQSRSNMVKLLMNDCNGTFYPSHLKKDHTHHDTGRLICPCSDYVNSGHFSDINVSWRWRYLKGFLRFFAHFFFQLVIQDGWDSNSTCKHYSHVSLLLEYLPLKICDTFVTPFLGGFPMAF